MLDIYNPTLTYAKGRTLDSSYTIIRTTLENNLNLVSNHIHNNNYSLPSDHLIPKLLTLCNVNPSRMNLDIKFITAGKLGSIASSLRLGSSNSSPMPIKNTLIAGGDELCILVDEDFNEDTPWWLLEPIEFLYHSYTNINFMLGNGKEGIGIYKINLSMLAVQYAGWLRANLDDGNIYNFSIKYPILNSIVSYTDISIFNRFDHILNDIKIPNEPNYSKVRLATIDDKLDRYIKQRIDYMTKQHFTMGGVLYNTPVVFKDSALELTDRLDVYSSVNTDAFELIYKLPYLRYVLSIYKQSGKLLDSSRLSSLTYELNALRNMGILDKLPKQLSLHIISNYLDPVMQLMNSAE